MPETQTVDYRHKTVLDPVEIVLDIADSPEYRAERKRGYTIGRSLSRTALRRAGIAEFPLVDTRDKNGHTYRSSDGGVYSHDDEDQYDSRDLQHTREANIAALIGALPSFVHGIEGLRHNDNERRRGNPGLPHRERKSLKQRTVRFNSAIKHMIATDPTVKFSNIADTVNALYGAINRERFSSADWREEQRWFDEKLRAHLRGMQQEVVAAQLIGAIQETELASVTVDTDVSIDDDLNGVDMWVTLDGETFPIDIKASDIAASKSRQAFSESQQYALESDEPRRYTPKLFTGITSEELKGNFRLSIKNARRRAPEMLTLLYRAQAEWRANAPLSKKLKRP